MTLPSRRRSASTSDASNPRAKPEKRRAGEGLTFDEAGPALVLGQDGRAEAGVQGEPAPHYGPPFGPPRKRCNTKRAMTNTMTRVASEPQVMGWRQRGVFDSLAAGPGGSGGTSTRACVTASRVHSGAPPVAHSAAPSGRLDGRGLGRFGQVGRRTRW